MGINTENNNIAYKKYKAAAINCDAILKDKKSNNEKQYNLVEEAAKNGAKLIALPEMANIGYCWYSRQEIAPYVETIPGETTELYQKIASQYDCYIVVGLAEVDPDTDIYYNSAALIGPSGIIGVHRKTHPFVSENKWSKQGDKGHQVYDTPIGKIGILICMDINFMETARLEGIKNADVIVNISGWNGEKAPGVTWYTRAFENGCYILESDRLGYERGVEFNGGSCIIDPHGNLISNADDMDGIIYGDIDLEISSKKDFEGKGNKLTERMPSEYMNLVADTYLWSAKKYNGLYGYDPLPDGKQSKIAVVQFAPKAGDIEYNLNYIQSKIKKLALDGNELIVFPELSLTGFPKKDEAKAFADKIPNDLDDRLLDLCIKHRVHIIIGLIDKEDDTLYNAAILYSPEGVLGKYRKIHLSNIDEGWAAVGNLGFERFNTKLGRIGILIGHDAMFPESARVLALEGTDIICCPSAVTVPKPRALDRSNTIHNYPEPYGYSNMHWHLWRVRAGENNCYLAFANAVGALRDETPLIGRSGIFQPAIWEFPKDEIVLSSNEEESGSLVVDTYDGADSDRPTSMVRGKYMLTMRQPLWYDDLVKKA